LGERNLRVNADENMAEGDGVKRKAKKLCLGDAFVYSIPEGWSALVKIGGEKTVFERFMLTLCGVSYER
jgi:hypothetical protein